MLSAAERAYLRGRSEGLSPGYQRVLQHRLRKKALDAVRDLELILSAGRSKSWPDPRAELSFRAWDLLLLLWMGASERASVTSLTMAFEETWALATATWRSASTCARLLAELISEEDRMKKSGEVVLSDCEGQEKEMDRYSRLADTIERLMKEERASGGGLSRIGQYGPWRTRLHEAGDNGIWVRVPKEKAET